MNDTTYIILNARNVECARMLAPAGTPCDQVARTFGERAGYLGYTAVLA